jgi:hypothetical protein
MPGYAIDEAPEPFHAGLRSDPWANSDALAAGLRQQANLWRSLPEDEFKYRRAEARVHNLCEAVQALAAWAVEIERGSRSYEERELSERYAEARKAEVARCEHNRPVGLCAHPQCVPLDDPPEPPPYDPGPEVDDEGGMSEYPGTPYDPTEERQR